MQIFSDKKDEAPEIMILDDEELICNLFTTLFKKKGYKTRFFLNGKSALISLKDKIPDLILTDIKMPSMTGFEFCKIVKADQKLKHIPVLFMSGYQDEVYLKEIYSVGGADFISKNLDLEIFLAKIENQLKIKQLQQKLENSLMEAERFRDALDKTPSYIFMKDTKFRYIYANFYTLKLFGCSAEELIGRDDYSFFTPDVAKRLQEIDSRVFAGEDTVEQVVDNEKKKIYLEIKTPLYSKYGDKSIYGLLGISTDVSGLIDLQEKLRHSQKMEAIGVLAAGIAHEINSPMQYILDNTRFLEDNVVDLLRLVNALKQHDFKCDPINCAKIKEVLNSLDVDFLNDEIPLAISESIHGISKVRNIVSALKDFSTPRGEVQVLVDINKTLETILLITGNNWKLHATINKDYDTKLPLLPCYADELNQVFINLIVNAADAIRAKGSDQGVIEISTKRLDNSLQIIISDNGVGIKPEIIDRVFEPFFTTKEVGQGTGQGLAVVYDIIHKLHKGTIEVQSEIGVGTKFVIQLPIDN